MKAQHEEIINVPLTDNGPYEPVTIGFNYEEGEEGYMTYEEYYDGKNASFKLLYIRKADGTTPTEEELPLEILEEEINEIASQYGFDEFTDYYIDIR